MVMMVNQILEFKFRLRRTYSGYKMCSGIIGLETKYYEITPFYIYVWFAIRRKIIWNPIK